MGTHYKIAVRQETVGWWKHSVEKRSFERNGLFSTTQKQTIICEAQARSELEEFSFSERKRERSKRSCASEKEHKVNALAPRAEEGRDKLR